MAANAPAQILGAFDRSVPGFCVVLFLASSGNTEIYAVLRRIVPSDSIENSYVSNYD